MPRKTNFAVTMTFRPFISLIIAATVSGITLSGQVRRTVALTTANGVRSSAYLAEEVDVRPAFPGGDHKLYQFINAERRYPADAWNNGIHGRVVCSFIVSADGQISHIEVVRGVDPSLDAEACRIIAAMPRWTPGIIDGSPVATYCLLPISFRR